MKWSTPLIAAAVAAVAACSPDSARTADTSAVMADTTPAAAMPVETPAPSAPAGGMLDPNAATEADLATIPGVTAEVAAAIVAGRPYPSMVELDKRLASVPEQARDSVFSRLWVPIDINTATDAEMLLIPGVGPRMLREFKEYRPYTSMDQWRREIGKYVDAAELARLERYVAIR